MMESVPAEANECAQNDFKPTVETQIEPINEAQNVNSSISVGEKFEELIKSEVYDDNVIEIKPICDIPTTESYIIRDKPKVVNEVANVKTKNIQKRQVAATKSVVERPKTAREKIKTNEKGALKVHQLGKMPAYLKKMKSTKLSSASEVERPNTIDSSNLQYNINNQSIKEEQGDVRQSLVSVLELDDHKNSLEKIKTESLSQSSKMLSLRNQIMDLEMKNGSLEKQLKEMTSARASTDNQLKNSLDKIKSLENKIFRINTEQKKYEDSRGNNEVEIANLIREKQELTIEIKCKTEENQKLKSELKTKSSSLESLNSEKKHLEMLLEHEKLNKGKGDATSEQLENLLNENQTLKRGLNEKNIELNSLKQDKHNLIDELNHLQSQLDKASIDSMNQNLGNEYENLQHKIQELTRNEKELNQKILTLTSKLDDERDTNIRNSAILETRNDYIRVLQDMDNANKTRIVLRAKELEDTRKHIKAFEKFKAAHEEEKHKFKKFLKDLQTENTILMTKIKMYEKMGFNLNQK